MGCNETGENLAVIVTSPESRGMTNYSVACPPLRKRDETNMDFLFLIFEIFETREREGLCVYVYPHYYHYELRFRLYRRSRCAGISLRRNGNYARAKPRDCKKDVLIYRVSFSIASEGAFCSYLIVSLCCTSSALLSLCLWCVCVLLSNLC